MCRTICSCAGNKITNTGRDALAEAIKQSKLQYLTDDKFDFKPGTTQLSCNRKGMGDCELRLLAAVVQVSSAPLSELNLRSSSFTAAGIGPLAAALPYSKLTKLEMDSCGLKDDSIEVLAPALSKAPLQNCNLLWNSFSVEASKQLVEAAKQSKTLKSLCGNEAGNTTLDRSGWHLKDPDVPLVIFDIEMAPLKT